jgi:hypothetical protein
VGSKIAEPGDTANSNITTTTAAKTANETQRRLQ